MTETLQTAAEGQSTQQEGRMPARRSDCFECDEIEVGDEFGGVDGICVNRERSTALTTRDGRIKARDEEDK